MLWLTCVFILAIWAWPALWLRAVRAKVLADIAIDRREIAFGEACVVHIALRNLSWLPVPVADLLIQLPEGLSAKKGETVRNVRRTTFLWMRQEARFSVTCYGVARGVHRILTGDVQLRVHEGFGLQSTPIPIEVETEVAVWPATAEGASMADPAETLGQIEQFRWLHLDETLLRGIRPYAPGDAYKHLAWHASARSGTWMTKEFAASTDRTVTLALNAQFFDPYWNGTRHSEFDRLCEMVCAWASQLERRGFMLHLAANALVTRDGRRQWHGQQTSTGISSLLSRAVAAANGPFEDVLHRLRTTASGTSPVLVFTAMLTARQIHTIAELARSGRMVVVAPSPGADGSVMQVRAVTGVQLWTPREARREVQDENTAASS